MALIVSVLTSFVNFFRDATARHGSGPHEASRSHSDTPHSVEPLWTRDQPDAETSTWTNTTLPPPKKDIQVPDRIRTRNPSKRATADPRLRPRGQTFRENSERNLFPYTRLVLLLYLQFGKIFGPQTVNLRPVVQNI